MLQPIPHAVIYLPVDTPEMRGQAERWGEGVVEFKEMAAFPIIAGPAAPRTRPAAVGALAGVHRETRVYILLHGQPARFARGDDWTLRVPTVGARRGGRQVRFTPRQLARNLHFEGLDCRIRDIRLFACNGANGTRLRPSFGARLKAELVKRGYSAAVSAYSGPVKPTYGKRWARPEGPAFLPGVHKGVRVDGHRLHTIRASERRVTY